MTSSSKKSTLCAVLGSLALAVGGACKGTSDDNDHVDNHDDRTDVSVDRSGHPAPATPPDTAGATATGGTVSGDLARARADFSAEMKERLARVDDRLSALRAQAGADKAAADLQVERDRLAAKLDAAETQASDGWDQFKSDLQRGFDHLDAEISAEVH
ncbi:MAG TPA: hypothetical protein VHE35_00595 [Kofleriaceae bacterium]|nr:hypothetical protein [Kofleriaceae bacterium]